MRGSPKRGRQNSNFLTTHTRHMKFSGEANNRKVPPKRGSPKFKVFNLLSCTHGIRVKSSDCEQNECEPTVLLQ